MKIIEDATDDVAAERADQKGEGYGHDDVLMMMMV